MTLPTELDDWAAWLATVTGYVVTRDPDMIFPPCVFVELPDLTAVTLPAVQMDVPVYVLGDGTGKQGSDVVLTMLPKILTALDVRDARPTTYSQGGIDFHGYTLTARLITHLTPETPPAPPTQTIPAAPGPAVPSNWIETGGSWQFDLTWSLSPDDGGSPILRHALLIDGDVTVVDGNTGFLGAVFSSHYPIDVYVEAINAVGNSLPSSATITPPTP